MRIQKLRVEKLFHCFDHEIALKLNERVTMIYAPNGFGKTAILRMLHGLFNGRMQVFREYPFERFEVTFEDGRVLSVAPKKALKPESEPRWRRDRVKLEIDFTGCEPSTVKAEIDDVRGLGLSPSFIEQNVPGLIRLDATSWQSRSGEILDLAEVLDRYGEFIPKIFQREFVRFPEWFRDLIRTCEVNLIGTDRLQSSTAADPSYGRSNSGFTPTVARYSQELAQRIESTLANYAKMSQSLERTFPVRLMDLSADSAMTKEEIKNKLNDFELRREQLTETGLLDPNSIGDSLTQNPTIDDARVPILSVFVGDTEKKLEVLDELSRKIDLFRSVINSRFQHKHMKISKEKGFFFVTDNDQPLDATKLSSGEQHEVIMLFELLFHVKPDALVLMDEPEISLHVVWQQQFLKDLLKMTALSHFDVLLATHSPLIIDDRWDLTVGLGDK